MSIQIAVRLPDEQVAFLDAEVAAGRATSRADLIERLLAQERRRARALADLEKLRAAGLAGNPDLADVAAATADRRIP